MLKNLIPKFLNQLTAMIGSDPSLIQGPGGNISLKDGDQLIIKASGTWMSRAMTANIFSVVSLHEALRRFKFDEPDLPPDNFGLRPSIETTLHALMPKPLVLHTHMISSVIWGARPQAEQLINEKLSGLNYSILPYQRPGRPLSLAASKLLQASGSPPEVIILKNHGLLLGADNGPELINLLNDCLKRLAIPIRPFLQPRTDLLLPTNDLDWDIPLVPLFHAPALDPVALKVAQGPPLYPDHAVFLGPRMLILEPGASLASSLDDFTARFGFSPKVAIQPQAGVLTAPDASSGTLAMLGALSMAGLMAPESVALEGLSDDECRQLAHLDAEKHRLLTDAAQTGNEQ
ncbi:MAG: class II aldolase/adducin family protein [Deltaproteobacteria bacterium]|jgi:rhamnose utilization protein RhaD (predicted bifunctional aldolase and dehydrogenase)|nr:class II aldolase/adducin family protein [Deltaproteobacteria bacterium]